MAATTLNTGGSVCWGCTDAKDEKRHICLACESAFYCAATCQNSDLKLHERECALLKEVKLLKGQQKELSVKEETLKFEEKRDLEHQLELVNVSIVRVFVGMYQTARPAFKEAMFTAYKG